MSVRSGRGARARLSRAARLGALSVRAAAGWATGALLDGLGSRGPAAAIRGAAAARAAERLGAMKGLATKLGQVLSFALDDLPDEVRAPLAALQTFSSPRPFEEIAAVIERSLGRPLRQAFRHVDRQPLAAASIGQVHRAILHDGAEVAVKVQYPDVAAAVRADLANLSLLVSTVRLLAPGVDAGRVARELKGRVLEELDYAREARNQSAFAARFEGHPFVSVPHVIGSLSSPEVLTTELVHGLGFGDALREGEDERSRYGEILFRFVYGCMFGWGTFDADPHPGNYLFDRGGTRVAFLDFGCVKRIPAALREEWRAMLRAALDGDRETSLAHAMSVGFVQPGAEASGARIVEALTRVYLPFRLDGPQRFPSLWSRIPVKDVLGGDLAEVRRHLSVPKDLVFANRTLAGIYLVLARLGATASWGRMAREYVCGDDPSTPMGDAEAAWAKRRRRGG